MPHNPDGMGYITAEEAGTSPEARWNDKKEQSRQRPLG